MSPQDKVERVLKEIHVAFSKSPTYNGQPDKMIVDRKEFLMLLDRLNRGIYDMMEQYEQTRQSRANAERSFRRKGNEIIAQANASAEDIYAASVIYTSDAIGRIRDLMDQTNDSMDDLFRQFRRELREQKDMLRSHESELQAQLADLADTKKYLDLLQDINRERERKLRDQEAEWEKAEPYARRSYRTAATAADVKVNQEYFEKPDAVKPAVTEPSEPVPAEKPDIIINKDAPYFKWKEEQEKKKAGEPAGSSETASSDEEPAAAEEEKSGIGTVESDADISDAERILLSFPEANGDADDEDFSNADEIDLSNPEFPDEEAIYQAVLEDERLAEKKKQEMAGGRERPSAAGILKTLIFGKD